MSINDNISDTARHFKAPHVMEYLRFFHEVQFVTLRDLKDAFRQLLLALDDREYIQYSLFGMTFIDTRQAYGVASAGARCQDFAMLLLWILENKTSEFADEYARILAYIDDYTFGANTFELCNRLTIVFDKVFKKLNIAISTEKNQDCIQTGVAHGIGFRLKCDPKTVFIPRLKVRDSELTVILSIHRNRCPALWCRQTR